MHTKSANNVWFYRYCKFLIAYTVLIIAWGAWVRISGSGAGCGEHWPLCNGKAIPLGDGSKTWVEVSHRYSTAIFGVLIVLLCGFSYRVRSNNNLHRLGAYAVLLFTVFEALIGRSLVTEGLVDQDVSVARAVLMPLHLVNTSLLLFAEVLTMESVRFGTTPTVFQRRTRLLLTSGIVLIIFTLLTTGALASLATHIAPSSNLMEGIHADLNPSSHIAVRLRPLHLVAGFSTFLMATLAVVFRPGPLRSFFACPSSRTFSYGLIIMALLGTLTLAFHSPVYLKMAHLITATVLVVLASKVVIELLFYQPLSE